MKLQNLLSRLEKHHKKKLDLSLGRTFNLLKKLGNPQNKLENVISIVGTNSKASMAYSLQSILKQNGYKCNLYTSPHLTTVFEILTCAFIKNAENFKDNINIIESGLFHQYDSTNVFKENLSTLLGVIHNDHFQWL